PAVQVAVVDPSTNNPIDFDNSDTVTLTLSPTGVTLGGMLTRTVVNGIATFDDLTITRAGTGYTMAAGGTGLTGATSGPFAVSPAAADRLVFLQQPTDSVAGVTINPAVTVEVVDAFGNVEPGDNTTIVTLTLSPSGVTLGGTSMRAVVNGVATFDDLTI